MGVRLKNIHSWLDVPVYTNILGIPQFRKPPYTIYTLHCLAHRCWHVLVKYPTYSMFAWYPATHSQRHSWNVQAALLMSLGNKPACARVWLGRGSWVMSHGTPEYMWDWMKQLTTESLHVFDHQTWHNKVQYTYYTVSLIVYIIYYIYKYIIYIHYIYTLYIYNICVYIYIHII